MTSRVLCHLISCPRPRTVKGRTVLAVVVLAGPAWAASFTGLGDLPGGSFESRAIGVSADGSVVTGYSTSLSGQEGFVWTAADGMHGIGDLPGGTFSSTPLAISADGTTVVGWSSSNNGGEAFRWTRNGGMVGLGDLPGGHFASVATGVSADGQVITGIANLGTPGEGPQAFRWTPATGMQSLGYGRAEALSADGQVIAVWRGNQTEILTPNGSFTLPGLMPGDLSPDGSIIVGVLGGEATLWSAAGGFKGLGDLPTGPFYSNATAVSSDGSVVVGYSLVETRQPWPVTGDFRAFVWDEAHGMRSVEEALASCGVHLDGWELVQAWGVSADGRVIVGNGKNPQGKSEGWIANLRDTEPPVIVEANVHPSLIWPPNHKMHTVTVDALVEDDCEAAQWKVSAVECSEDFADNDVEFLGDGRIRLRATRDPRRGGRTYIIVIEAHDAAGNVSEPVEVQVVVPKSSKK